MDRFTRNYTITLAVIILAVLAWALYEDPLVQDLNDLLEQESDLVNYPYQFRVVRLQNGIPVMSTPRSTDFPVYRALGILYPHLANRAQDNPDLMQAQQELARIQKRAKEILMQSDSVNSIRWELDKDWLSQHGVVMGPNY
ncbi:MAG: glutamate-ammonia-ligase adenylyltransferase [Pseudomonadota bacterium]